jgi:hypothetical protein
MEGAPTASKSELAGEGKFDPASFKDDPLIKKALDLFKGQIVNVRS